MVSLVRKPPPPKVRAHSLAFVQNISEQVYRARLELECPGNVEKMVAKDEDDGKKLKRRSGAYDSLTRAYLKVLGVPVDG